MQIRTIAELRDAWQSIEETNQIGANASIYELKTAEDLRLSEILKLFLPGAVEMPHGLGEITFENMDLQIASDKTARLQAQAAGKWQFPFGESVPEIEKAVLNLEKQTDGLAQCRLEIEGAGTLTDDINFKKIALVLQFDREKNWQIGGGVKAEIFEKEFALSASYQTKQEKEFLKLAFATPETDGQPQTLIEIEELCRLSITELAFWLASEKQAQTTWSFDAKADFTLFAAFAGESKEIVGVKNGELKLSAEREKSLLIFKAEGTKINLPVCRYRVFENECEISKSFEISTAFDFLEISRGNAGDLFFEAACVTKFKDVPAPLDKIFADEISGKVLINNENALIILTCAANPFEFAFPPIETSDSKIEFGAGCADLRDISLVFGKDEFCLTGDLAVGLPSELNKLFGTDEQGKAAVKIFRTFKPDGNETEKEESLIRFGLDFSAKGLGGKLKNSPLEDVKIKDGKLIIDLCEPEFVGTDKDLGRIEIDLPEFRFDLEKGSFQAKGGFKIDKERGLKIPLAFLGKLLKLLQLDDLAEQIPDSLPVTEFKFFDENSHQLRTRELFDFCEKSGVEIPLQIRQELEKFSHLANRLPDRFKQYLNASIPGSLNFEIDITPDGGVRFNVQCDKQRPLKILIPNFPNFFGVELRGISFGEAFSGSLFIIDADFRLDMFDVPTLVLCLAVPFEDLPQYLPPSAAIHRTLIVDELLLFIIYQTSFPIPVPVFYNEIGVSYLDAFGIELESHFHFPKPRLNLIEVKNLLSEFIKFFSHISEDDDKYLINLDRLPKQSNIRYTVGANYFRLPKFFGLERETDDNGNVAERGNLLGFKEDLGTFDGFGVLAVLLNSLKKRSVNYLIRQTDLRYRIGSKSIKLFGTFDLESVWAITAPPEFVENAYPIIREKTAENFKKLYPNKKLPVPAETSEIIELLSARSDVAQTTTTAEAEGLVVFLHGILAVGEVLFLDSACALLCADAHGFGCTLAFRGAIANALEIKLFGLVKIDPNADGEKFSLNGKANFKLLEREVFSGEFFLCENGFGMKGEIDLFPEKTLPEFPLRIYSEKPLSAKNEDACINGRLAKDVFTLEGRVNFKLGLIKSDAFLSVKAGKSAPETSVEEIVLRIYFFDSIINFKLFAAPQKLLFDGAAASVNYFGGLLKIYGEGVDGKMPARLAVENDEFKEFYLCGNVELLGIRDANVRIDGTPDGFFFRLGHGFNLSGFSSECELNCALIPKEKLTAESEFSLPLDLGKVLQDLIREVTKLDFQASEMKTNCLVKVNLTVAEAVKPETVADKSENDFVEVSRQNAEKAVENLQNKFGGMFERFDREHNAAREKVSSASRESGLKLTLSINFKFLGLALELSDVDFQMDDLAKQDWRENKLLSDLPERVLQEISRNLPALLEKSLGSFRQVFRHLVSFVFDENFRNKCLHDKDFRVENSLQNLRSAAENLIKQNLQAENALLEAGWSGEELEKLR